MTKQRSIMSLHGRNIVVYDMETQYLAGEERNGERVSWARLDLMGISSGALYDYQTGDTTIYLQDNLHELPERLKRADLIVGFNSKTFDNALLRQNGLDLPPDDQLPNFDILEHLRKAAGWDGKGIPPGGCKLDDCLRATFGESMLKTGDGAMAPELFRAGKLGALLSYNVADVRRHRVCFEHIWAYGTLSAKNGKYLMPNPELFIRDGSQKGASNG